MAMSGECLCGGVMVTGQGKPGPVSICHCPQCLKQGAGPYMGVRFSGGVTFKGNAISWFRSSPHAERGFCRTCGSTISWKMQSEESGSVNVHLFDYIDGLKVGEEIFIDSPPDWYFSHPEAVRQTRAEALGDLRTYLANRPGDI
jgi:hypothetical protein